MAKYRVRRRQCEDRVDRGCGERRCEFVDMCRRARWIRCVGNGCTVGVDWGDVTKRGVSRWYQSYRGSVWYRVVLFGNEVFNPDLSFILERQ